MNTNSPSQITYSTPTGPVVGTVLSVQAEGYMVRAPGGTRVFVNFGFVHFSS